MGANGNNGDFKAAFDKLVADFHMQFDDIKGQFHSINDRLTSIEQRGGTEEDAAAAARAERERKAIATKLEVDARKAMEDAGRAFLKQQKEASSSSTILEIVDDLEGKLFNDHNKMEPPRTNLPPPFPYQGTLPGSFPVLTPRLHKLHFPMCDNKEDPLPWINRCEQFFRGQKTLETEQVWYASYHMAGGVQQWYMRMMQDKTVTDWAYFA
jgi:hypothetical protein